MKKKASNFKRLPYFGCAQQPYQKIKILTTIRLLRDLILAYADLQFLVRCIFLLECFLQRSLIALYKNGGDHKKLA